MLAVIDGDLILYSTLFYHEARYSDENPATCEILEEKCVNGVLNVVREWKKLAGCDEVIVALSESPNFRHRVDPEYKANRQGGEKPVYFYEAKSELKIHFPCLEFPGCIEADDVMGIMGTHYEDCVIISYDKDMRQIPGLHLNPKKKGAQEVERISIDEARRTFYCQWLQGDSTDNIKGISGIGPKKALGIYTSTIQRSEDPIQAVLKEFEKKGISKERAIKDFHLVKILSNNDWDFATNTMKEVDYGKTPEEPECYRTPAS